MPQVSSAVRQFGLGKHFTLCLFLLKQSCDFLLLLASPARSGLAGREFLAQYRVTGPSSTALSLQRGRINRKSQLSSSSNFGGEKEEEHPKSPAKKQERTKTLITKAVEKEVTNCLMASQRIAAASCKLNLRLNKTASTTSSFVAANLRPISSSSLSEQKWANSGEKKGDQSKDLHQHSRGKATHAAISPYGEGAFTGLGLESSKIVCMYNWHE